VFPKNWAYRFASLAITSPMFSVQNNSKYSRGLQGSSKSTFMPGLPANGKCRHSAPEFAYTSRCMLLLSVTFSASSELTLCSTFKEMFIFISVHKTPPDHLNASSC
jgi:hypothetical protein